MSFRIVNERLRGARRARATALIATAALAAGLLAPGVARAQDHDLELTFARGLYSRGPAFYELAREAAEKLEANASKSKIVRGHAGFLVADIQKSSAQRKGDDPEELKKYEALMEKFSKRYPDHPRTKGADFDILRARVDEAKGLMGAARASEDPKQIADARTKARGAFEDALSQFDGMIQQFSAAAGDDETDPAKGEARYKRNLAELVKADTLYDYATNIYDEGSSERNEALEKALAAYTAYIENRYEFANLLAYGYMGEGKCLYDLGRLQQAADRFGELTAYDTGITGADQGFMAEIRKLENDVRTEAFFRLLQTQVKAGLAEEALNGVLEIFGSWLAKVQSLPKAERPHEPEEVERWIRSFLPQDVAVEAIRLAGDIDAGRYIWRLRETHFGRLGLMEAARAISASGAHDRAGGLLMAVVEDSRKSGEPRAGALDIDIYGYAAAKVLSELLDEEGVSLPSGAAFYAGQGYSFRNKWDEALHAYRMAVAAGAETGDQVYPGRALLELGTVYYDKKKAYLQAGLAFKALAERYPGHPDAADAARKAEESFSKVEGDEPSLKRLRDVARSLVQRSGTGEAPERHRFERAADLEKQGNHQAAAQEFDAIREIVTGPGGAEIRISFYLVAQVQAGKNYFLHFQKNATEDKALLARAIEKTAAALEKAKEQRDLRARAMGVFVLGGLIHDSDEVADYAAAVKVLSILDEEPELAKELSYAAPARDKQIHALLQLGRIEDAGAAWDQLEGYLAGMEQKGETAQKALQTSAFNAAYNLASAVQEKIAEGADPSALGKYAAALVSYQPPMRDQDKFELLGWTGGLAFLGGDLDTAIRIYEEMLQLYVKNWRDKVTLRDGNKVIEGEILEESKEEIVILVGDASQKIEMPKVDRVQRMPPAIQGLADQARVNLAEAYLGKGETEKAIELFRFLYGRARYRGEYRVLEGFAESQLRQFDVDKNDRWLTPKGAARDLFQQLFGLVGTMEDEQWNGIKKPTDPPREEKKWELRTKILECLIREKQYDEVQNQVSQLRRLEAFDEDEFPFQDIRKALLDVEERAKARR